MNPSIVVFRPQYEPEIQKAVKVLHDVWQGKISTAKNNKDFRHIVDENSFQEYLLEMEKADKLVVDIETTSLSPRRGEIIGVAFSTKPHQGVFVDAWLIESYAEKIQSIFSNTCCIFHNAKFDMAFLKYEFGFEFPVFEDTMLLHYALEEAVGTHGLKLLALKYTDLGDYEKDLDTYKKEFCRKQKIKLADFNYGMLPIDILAPYAQRDGDATFQLYNKFKPLVEKNEKLDSLYKTMLLPATISLMQLENNGGPVDKNSMLDLIKDYTIDIEECKNEIDLDPAVIRFERIEGKEFNPNSVAHLRKVLFDYKGLTPTKKTEGGAWSVDKEVLANLDDPFCKAIIDLREKVKLKGTYLKNIYDGIDKDGRLRSSFNITGTTSGRLSSSGTINYQNIPRDNKDIKKLFKAREGYSIVQADLGTAEVYYAAVLSNDKFLQSAFKSGLDFHSYIAKQMFGLSCDVEEIKNKYPNERQYAKSITFGIMYQAGAARIADEVNNFATTSSEMITMGQAKNFINKYFAEASNLKKFIDGSNKYIENNAYIYSYFGRKRRLSESRSPNRGVAKHAIRSGVNFLVQSVASDINVLALIDAFKWIEQNNLYKDIIPFTVVHDSIVSEVENTKIDMWAKNLKQFIQTDRGISITDCPIKVDFEVGPSWGELKLINV